MEVHPIETTRRTILVADDDRAMRDVLRRILCDEGYDVVECENGVRLLDELGPLMATSPKATRYDLVIVDIRMPIISGLEVLENVGCHGNLPPIIVITAFGDDAVEWRVRELGAVLLNKPFSTRELVDLVRKALPERNEI